MTTEQAENLLIAAQAIADILIQKGCASDGWSIKQATIDWLGTRLFEATHTKDDDGKWVPLEV